VDSHGNPIIQDTTDLVRFIYWNASKKYKHFGEEFINTFRQEFMRMCIEDGVYSEELI